MSLLGSSQMASPDPEKADSAGESAKVLVLNHSLFFNFLAGAEAALEERGYLFHNDFIIFDEAHTLRRLQAGAQRIMSVRDGVYKTGSRAAAPEGLWHGS